jgi:peptidoglycan/xylan/chitin deacetylase (PgdA/CDA1 family)
MWSIYKWGMTPLTLGKLSVFLFHKVPVRSNAVVPTDTNLEAFEFLLDTAIAGFQIIPFEEAVIGLQARKLPPRAACITFDDGYSDWLTGMAPALERRNLHATLFITAGQFDGIPLWHERIARAIHATTVTEIDLSFPAIPPLPLANMFDRQAAVARLERDLKYLTLHTRNALLKRLETLAGVQVGDVSRMTISQLRELHGRGFGIGAHTYQHPILDYCDEAEAVQEIATTREILSFLIGGPVNAFAYPNGRPYVDFSRNHVEMVKRAGYTSAVTTQRGVAEYGSSVFQIPRFTPWGTRPLHFALQVGRNLLTVPKRVSESVA